MQACNLNHISSPQTSETCQVTGWSSSACGCGWTWCPGPCSELAAVLRAGFCIYRWNHSITFFWSTMRWMRWWDGWQYICMDESMVCLKWSWQLPDCWWLLFLPVAVLVASHLHVTTSIVSWFLARSRISSMATNAELIELFDKLFFWLWKCQPYMPYIQATCPASSYNLFWLAYSWGTMFVQVDLIVTLPTSSQLPA